MNKILNIIFCLFLSLFLKGQIVTATLNINVGECQLANANVAIETTTTQINYTWSNGETTASVSNLENGDYQVTVSDGNGQDTVINFTIENLPCEPKPENHFTPNNDGFNDTWSIRNINSFPEFDLYVYNRWGQQVHHQTGIYIPWDGRSLTMPLPDATYYYVLYFSRSDKDKFVKGSISILR